MIRRMLSGTLVLLALLNVTAAQAADAASEKPAIISSPARLERLKKGFDWWYRSEIELKHVALSFNAAAHTFTFNSTVTVNKDQTSPHKREQAREIQAEAVFTAEALPRLVSFRRTKPLSRKSDATGTVEGDQLKGVDFDGDAYSLPYRGDLIPDFALDFVALAMDWSRTPRTTLLTFDPASQDLLPPVIATATREPDRDPALSRWRVYLGKNYFFVNDNDRFKELAESKDMIFLPCLAPAPEPKPEGPGEIELPDNAITNAIIGKMLKDPPATGQLIQSVNEHALGVGLLPGDVVTKYDGTVVESLATLRDLIGKAVQTKRNIAEVEFIRAGKAYQIHIPTGQIGIFPISIAKGVETNLDDAMFGPMGFGPGPKAPPTKYEKLAREKCGSQITWLDSYAAALEQAKAQHKVVLWWATPIHGSSIYKLDVFSDFLNVGLFTDPEIVAFVKRYFVPFNAPLTKKQMDDFQLGFLTAPAFLFVDGDGKLLHYVDGLTTIQREFFMKTFETVVRSTGVDIDLQHLIQKEGLQYFVGAQKLEREHKAADAIGLLQTIDLKSAEGAALADHVETEIPWIQLRSGHPERVVEALQESALEKDDRPRAIERMYLRGAALLLLNKDDEVRAIWKRAADKAPDDPWAWRAAAELENIGPLSRGVESPYWLPDNVLPAVPTLATLPHTTRPFLAEANVDNAVRIGVEYLLEHQSADGGWNDTNYDFGGIRAMPNVRTAVTAICAEALLAHRDVAPARVDTALNRAFAYVIDRAHMNEEDKNEIIWAHVYRLNFFCAWLKSCAPELRPKLLSEMQTIAATLTKDHVAGNGFFRHEYENDFVTGSVLLSLKLAKDAGIAVDERALRKSLDALDALRSPRGTFPYDTHPESGPVAWKGCAGRTINCEAALLAWGRSSADALRVAIEKYIEFNFVQERVRKETFHSDAYRIGGFFYWYNQHVLSQVTALTDPETAQKAAKFMREMVLSTREADGTWVDSIELGKTYATGMALLVLDAAKRFGKF